MRSIVFTLILCVIGIPWLYGNDLPYDMNNQSEIDAFNHHYNLGNEYLKGNVKLGDYDGKRVIEKGRVKSLQMAIAEYNKCLEILPDHWQSILLKSLAYQALGDHEKSLNLIEKAIVLQPENYVLYKEASIEAIHNRDIRKALIYSRRATVLKLDDPELLGNHAMNLLIAGEDRESYRTIKYAIEIAPDDKFNVRLRGIIEGVLNGKRLRPTVENVFQ